MENPITEEVNYKTLKREAKQFYSSLKKVWSPALNEDVTFNSSGFRHLVWQKKTPRRQKEQIKRFGLLPHVAEVINSPDKSFEYRRISKQTGDVQFWGFAKQIEVMQIKVVVRQVGNGNKHFFSIFEKKQKTARK